jgi:uncharacterized protein (TIGR01777 family)
MQSSKNKIIIAAGTGFIGQAMINHFKEYEIVVLTRNSNFKSQISNLKYVYWNAKSQGEWFSELEGAKAVINLTGKSVNCRFNEKNKADILSSRIDSTKIIGEAIKTCKNPPQVWINASAAGIYPDSFEKQFTENDAETGNDFMAEVCMAWEKTLNEIDTPHTRKIATRITIVLGKSGGVFKTIKPLVKIGLGGKQGNGKQFVSWIHEKDLCRAVEFIIENNNLSGPINFAAPNPVRNYDFMKAMRTQFKVWLGIPQPAWLLSIGAWFMGTEKELVLKSMNVVPKRLTENGFIFKYSTMEQALQDLAN